MKLILKNHSEEYAAREIIASHIPKIKIELSDVIPASGDYVLSGFAKQNNGFVYSAIVSVGGKKNTYTLTSPNINKIYVKKTINEALKPITKVSLPWGLITGIRPSKMVRELYKTGKTTNEIKDHFLKHFECSDNKTELAIKVAQSETELISSMPKNAVSLYVGIPFCPTRCLYCSFTSQSIKFSNKLTEPYMDALTKEIQATAEIIQSNGLTIDTVYIGGGTPTSLNGIELKRLLNEIYENFDLSHIREFTLEAGRPDTINEEKLKIIRDFGISRISINPQTTNEKTLKTIGRCHSTKDFLDAYELAVRQGFTHINTDLIAGLPDETPNDFINTLKHIESINPQSVTVHTMSVKRGSFLDEKYSTYTLSAASTVNVMLALAGESMKKLNKHPYYMYRQKNMLGNLENVGYCDTNHECLYNIYIMEEVQSIYAIGAGASTKIIDGDKIERIFNVKEVSEYIKRIDEMIERKTILKKL